MKRIGQFISVVFVTCLFIFVIQNLQAVDLSFASWHWRMTLAVPIVAAYLLGGLTGPSLWRLLNAQRKQRKEVKKVHKEAEKALKEKQRAEKDKQTFDA